MLHGLNAAVLLVLVATGLAIGDFVAPWLVARFGGHDVLDDVHQDLGLAFVAAVVLAGCVGWRAARTLACRLCRFRATERAWPLAFARHALAPSRHPPAEHAGAFDPAERVVLGVVLLAVVIAGASGVYLYFLPVAPRWVFLVAIRAHVYSAWVLIVALGIHIVAGLGVLPTHRGIARAMFGDGTVPLATARRLWPGWTRRRSGAGAPRE